MKGAVQSADGRPWADGSVRVYDVDLRQERLLASTTTDADGRYELTYTSEQGSSGPTCVGTAATRDGSWRARRSSSMPRTAETINVAIGGGTFRGASEYEQLTARLAPLLGKLALADLVEDDKHHDITFLVGETGLDRARITMLVEAHRQQRETGVAAEVLYGMFRQGLPTQLSALLVQSPAVQSRALVRSAEAGIIPPSFAEEADAVVDQLKMLLVADVMKPPTDGDGNNTAPL